jgi:hypothetical protein
MRKRVIDVRDRSSHPPAAMRRRLFWLLWRMSLRTLLVVTLAWLKAVDLYASISSLAISVRNLTHIDG